MINFIKEHKKIILIALILIIVSIGAYLIYGHFHPAKTVTTETQTQAETPAGVENAATNADVSISSDQAKEAASQIKEIAESDEAPSYTISTTAGQAQIAEKEAQESSGADFSIVTDKDSTTTTTDTTKLASSTPVELNQYNVQAYKKALQTLTATNQTVTYTVSEKVSKSGHYIGVTTGYNYKDHDCVAGLSYTW
ncbi:hypothetical protein [Pectinatus frisingensis]|uniref:hypothetical protein n=1 Tax=Pectinatus frisingensis TaxID=865 RepID=UPI003D807F6A